MKKGFTILFLILLSNLVYAQGNLYPGMVKLVMGTHEIYHSKTGDLSENKSDTVIFEFYNNPNSLKPVRHLSFYFDWSHVPRLNRIIEKDYHSWLKPMSFNDDTLGGFFNLYFVCKSQKDNWFEVIINEETQETLWIKDKRLVKFLNWKKLYKKDHITSIKAKVSTKIYNKPDATATEINYEEINCFEIIKVKGNWMQISNKDHELCGNYDEVYLDKGWIIFKSEDELFIELSTQ